MVSLLERRIIAAEVAMRDRLPVVACLFLSRVKPLALSRSALPVRDRFLRVAKAARTAVVLAIACLFL